MAYELDLSKILSEQTYVDLIVNKKMQGISIKKQVVAAIERYLQDELKRYSREVLNHIIAEQNICTPSEYRNRKRLAGKLRRPDL